MYFGNAVNPFMYMVEYLTSLVLKESKEESSNQEEGKSDSQEIIEISGMRSVSSREEERIPEVMRSLNISQIESSSIAAEHSLKHLSLIMSGSNMSSEAVPPLLKSLFKYLSAQRTLESF